MGYSRLRAETEECDMQQKVNDLRSALELLRSMPGQLVSTDVEVDPEAELSGIYRYVGAGGPRRKVRPCFLKTSRGIRGRVWP